MIGRAWRRSPAPRSRSARSASSGPTRSSLPKASTRSGVLSAGHARALLSLTSVEDQEKLALRIIREGMSVRTVEEIVAIGRWDASSLSGPVNGAAEDYLDLDDKPRKKSVRSGSRLSPA